jgi:hypothetical protein
LNHPVLPVSLYIPGILPVFFEFCIIWIHCISLVKLRARGQWRDATAPSFNAEKEKGKEIPQKRTR